MSLMERGVKFECGHHAERRVCKNGRTLIGEKIHCHVCSVENRVVSETPAVPFNEGAR